MRACQGHSLILDYESIMTPIEEGDSNDVGRIYHGTSINNVDSIALEGLDTRFSLFGSREHIHFTGDIDAVKKGERRAGWRDGSTAAVEVSLTALLRSGAKVYKTKNDAFLSRGADGNISPAFIRKITRLDTGEQLFPPPEAPIAVQVAIQREQLSRHNEITEELETKALGLAQTVLRAPEMSPVQKAKAAGVVRSVTKARASEGTEPPPDANARTDKVLREASQMTKGKVSFGAKETLDFTSGTRITETAKETVYEALEAPSAPPRYASRLQPSSGAAPVEGSAALSAAAAAGAEVEAEPVRFGEVEAHDAEVAAAVALEEELAQSPEQVEDPPAQEVEEAGGAEEAMADYSPVLSEQEASEDALLRLLVEKPDTLQEVELEMEEAGLSPELVVSAPEESLGERGGVPEEDRLRQKAVIIDLTDLEDFLTEAGVKEEPEEAGDEEMEIAQDLARSIPVVAKATEVLEQGLMDIAEGDDEEMPEPPGGRLQPSSGAAPVGGSASVSGAEAAEPDETAVRDDEAAQLVRAVVKMEEDAVARGEATEEQLEEEEVDTSEVSSYRERLSRIWKDQGIRAAKDEVARLYDAAGLDVLSNPVALKPMLEHLKRALKYTASSPMLTQVAAAPLPPDRGTAGAAEARKHIQMKREALTQLHADMQTAAVKWKDVVPRESITKAGGLAAAKSEQGDEELADMPLGHKRLQRMAIARKAEILGLRAEAGASEVAPSQVSRVVKSWMRSHQYHLLRRLSEGGFGAADRKAREEVFEGREKYHTLLEAGESSLVASQESMVQQHRDYDPELLAELGDPKRWPYWLQKARLDKTLPLSCYSPGSWVCKWCWGVNLGVSRKDQGRDHTLCTITTARHGRCTGTVMTSLAGYLKEPEQMISKAKKRSFAAIDRDREKLKKKRAKRGEDLRQHSGATWTCGRCSTDNLLARYQCWRCSWVIPRAEWDEAAGAQASEYREEEQQEALQKNKKLRGKRGQRKKKEKRRRRRVVRSLTRGEKDVQCRTRRAGSGSAPEPYAHLQILVPSWAATALVGLVMGVALHAYRVLHRMCFALMVLTDTVNGAVSSTLRNASGLVNEAILMSSDVVAWVRGSPVVIAMLGATLSLLLCIGAARVMGLQTRVVVQIPSAVGPGQGTAEARGAAAASTMDTGVAERGRLPLPSGVAPVGGGASSARRVAFQDQEERPKDSYKVKQESEPEGALDVADLKRRMEHRRSRSRTSGHTAAAAVAPASSAPRGLETLAPARGGQEGLGVMMQLLDAKSCQDMAVSLAANARSQIVLMGYTYDYPALQEALLAAAARKVSIKIGLDHRTTLSSRPRDQQQFAQQLQASGIEVVLLRGGPLAPEYRAVGRSVTGSGIQHAKTMYADDGHGGALVVIGSCNWTVSSRANSELSALVKLHQPGAKTIEQVLAMRMSSGERLEAVMSRPRSGSRSSSRYEYEGSA